MRALGVVAVALHAGCLGPLVDDSPALSGQLLPAGSTVPLADDDPVLAARIRAHVAVSGTVPLISAFADGAPIRGWDFGQAALHAIPAFELVDLEGEELDHPEIVDFAPGDDGYSPFWSLWTVRTTDRYAGELITSVAALDDARRLGLIEAPEPSGMGELGPIVTRDVLLERDDEDPATTGHEVFYYRGVAASYFELGDVELDEDKVAVRVARCYRLHREGGEALNEIVRGVDIDGDGDAYDSNDVMSDVAAGIAETAIYRIVDVIVPATVESIDTTLDQDHAEIRDVSQLFDPGPVPGMVLSFRLTDEVRVFALEDALE